MHSTNRITEHSKAGAKSTDDALKHSLSLLQRLRNVLWALFKKNPLPDQRLDSLLLENENFSIDLKELNQDIPKDGNDVNQNAKFDQIYYNQDDLLVTAQSMFSGNRKKPRKQPTKCVSQQILAKYGNYDENRERIVS